MVPGEVVQVIKGEHEGKRCRIRGTDGFFYHIELLTAKGKRSANGLVSVHRTAIAPLPDAVESPA